MAIVWPSEKRLLSSTNAGESDGEQRDWTTLKLPHSLAPLLLGSILDISLSWTDQ